MRYQGRITKWNDDKGFGFITPNGGGEPVFVHISSFSGRQYRPSGNEIVTYQLQPDGKGRLQAKAVSLVGQRRAPSGAPGRSNIPPVFAFGFLTAIAGAVAMDRLPVMILLVYLGLSALAFIVYALDKSAAQENRWRTSESTLHLLALFGGWPGALAAQRLLRHKSVKASFQIVFWVTVAINCAALAWLGGDAGAQVLRALSGIL